MEFQPFIIIMLFIYSYKIEILKNGKCFPKSTDGLPLKCENVFLPFLPKRSGYRIGKLHGLDGDRVYEKSQSGLRMGWPKEDPGQGP